MILRKELQFGSFNEFLQKTQSFSEFICMYIYDRQQSSQLLQALYASLETEHEVSPCVLLLEKSRNIDFLREVKLPSRLPALLCSTYGTLVDSTDDPACVKQVLAITKKFRKIGKANKIN